MSERTCRYYEFGEFRLDASKRVLLRNGELVHLTLKIFQLLLVLVENSGQILAKNDLMERVWPDSIVEEANLKNSISTLRRTLGDERGTEAYIQTIPKRGYRFVAPVIALPEEDETYLIEKHTRAEIIIDEIEVNSNLISAVEAHAGIGSHERASLPSNSKTVSRLLTTEREGAAGAVKKGSLRRFTRNKTAARAGVLLIATVGLALGLYMWFSAGKPKPAFSFDKMKMTRLINAGNGGAVISPDGKYIAYIMDGTSTDGLWVKQTATDSAVKLLPHVNSWGVTFSRDSNYVYCVLGGEENPEGALYKVPALGGPPRMVLNKINGIVGFSPDGSRMVFKRHNKEMGKPVLITADIDGSDERIVLPANPQYAIGHYDWAPDGKTIAVSVRGAPVDGQITYWVLEIPAAGGDERAITSPQREFISEINWLPDGTGLIMTAVDGATGLQQLWHLSRSNGKATRITNDSNWYAGATITVDAETILTRRTAAVTQNIWTGEDLNALRKTPAEGNCVKWTPDGKLLYVHGEDGKYDVWMTDAGSTERLRMTNDQSQNDWPEMSLDRRYIVFSSRRSGSRQVWRMDGDGRNPTQLTGGANQSYWPKITADGRWVVYLTWVSGSDWTIKTLPIDGGEPVTLVERAGEFVISPDGKMLAYSSLDEQKKRNIISIKKLEGDEPVKVLDFPDFPIFRIEQWTKDGLLCISAASTQIILVPVDGHQPRQLSDFKTGERIFSFALSADGRQVAISRGISSQEAVMITNFKGR